MMFPFSIAGNNREKNDAASITPADRAIIIFIKKLLTFLKNKTIAAPKIENKKAILPPMKAR